MVLPSTPYAAVLPNIPNPFSNCLGMQHGKKWWITSQMFMNSNEGLPEQALRTHLAEVSASQNFRAPSARVEARRFMLHAGATNVTQLFPEALKYPNEGNAESLKRTLLSGMFEGRRCHYSSSQHK